MWILLGIVVLVVLFGVILPQGQRIKALERERAKESEATTAEEAGRKLDKLVRELTFRFFDREGIQTPRAIFAQSADDFVRIARKHAPERHVTDIYDMMCVIRLEHLGDLLKKLPLPPERLPQKIADAIRNKRQFDITGPDVDALIDLAEQVPLQAIESKVPESAGSDEEKGVREDALSDIMDGLSKMNREYTELRNRDFIDGGHTRDCYVGATEDIHKLLARMTVTVPAFIRGKLEGRDIEAFTAAQKTLLAEAEADVRANGYEDALITKYRIAFHLTVEQVLKTARIGFNSLLPESDPGIAEDTSLSALKALPHLVEEAHRASFMAHFVFDLGPYWVAENKSRKKNAS